MHLNRNLHVTSSSLPDPWPNLRGFHRRREKSAEGRQIPLTEVAQAARVQVPNAPVDGRQQIQSLLSDVGAHDPPVRALTATTDEAPSFQPIEQPRDVGIAADQSIADLPTFE